MRLWKGTAKGLLVGLRLALLLRVRPWDLPRDLLLAPVSVVVSGIVLVALDLCLVEPPWQFNQFGLGPFLTAVAVQMLAALVLERLFAKPFVPNGAILVPLLASSPIVWVAHALAEHGLWAAGQDTGLAVVVPFVWLILITGRILRKVQGCDDRKGAAGAFFVSLCFLTSLVIVPKDVLVYQASGPEELVKRPARLDVEAIYFGQQALLEAALSTLEPQRPGVIDLYLVAVGGYASEAVFLHEAQAVQTLFDDRFDTAGRSLVLANHPDSLASLPLASQYNLQAVLRRLAIIMDPEEDILFLFLTSHGSSDHVLSLRFKQLGLKSMRADSLGALLRESGIKRKLVVISACYSGGFIEPLKDLTSLVITAAGTDRTSFGCGHDGDWTYFGRAFFGEALTEGHQFVEAFERAKLRVAAREREEGLTPSEPQIFIGSEIKEPLMLFQSRLP